MTERKPAPKYGPGKGKFAVLGLGNFGVTVARQLEQLGNEVLAVDEDDRRVDGLADELTHVVAADVRDQHALEELGLGDFDVAVVAIGEDLESNILCTLALKNLGIGKVWVKAVSPPHHHILTKLGADRIVHPEFEIGVHVAYSLNYPFILDYLNLGSDYFVVELAVTEALAEQPLAELELEGSFGVQLLALKRGNSIVSQDDPHVALRTGDRIVVLGKQERLRSLGAIL